MGIPAVEGKQKAKYQDSSCQYSQVLSDNTHVIPVIAQVA